MSSSGNLKIKHRSPPRNAMARPFSRSRRWKRQPVHSVMRIWSGKEDLVESTGEFSGLGR